MKNWYAFYLPWLSRLTGWKSDAIIDWSQAKIFSVMDIKDHPMAQRMAEEMQRKFSAKPYRPVGVPEEKQGLLAGDNA